MPRLLSFFSAPQIPPSPPLSPTPTPRSLLMDTYAERFYHPEALHRGAELFRDERSGAGARGQGGWGIEASAAVRRSCSWVGVGSLEPCHAMCRQPLDSPHLRFLAPPLPPPPPLPPAYTVPEGAEVEAFRAAIEALPAEDNPELFGLHSNADLTFRRLQVEVAALVRVGGGCALGACAAQGWLCSSAGKVFLLCGCA